MRILEETLSIISLGKIAEKGFGELVKAVVDVEKEIIAIDAELHSDLEALCIENGSKQNALWGINYYPEMEGEDFIEFDSMINLRPSQGNMSRDVESNQIRTKIVEITDKWIKKF
ncbi:MAG: hypothetical protein ISR95_06390 [Candidatus Marinimicrobia bacterium]|nr:hypothetical protein [Candidatus Neomarinimicrobiota bacterium]MBL7110070.1 hypothetical protein [Candidatus Neomarinimicrobiota bacterium]